MDYRKLAEIDNKWGAKQILIDNPENTYSPEEGFRKINVNGVDYNIKLFHNKDKTKWKSEIYNPEGTFPIITSNQAWGSPEKMLKSDEGYIPWLYKNDKEFMEKWFSPTNSSNKSDLNVKSSLEKLKVFINSMKYVHYIPDDERESILADLNEIYEGFKNQMNK